MQKSAGQLAYEEDVRRDPFYEDGAPRRTWAELHPAARWSWEINPKPRAHSAEDTEK